MVVELKNLRQHISGLPWTTQRMPSEVETWSLMEECPTNWWAFCHDLQLMGLKRQINGHMNVTHTFVLRSFWFKLNWGTVQLLGFYVRVSHGHAVSTTKCTCHRNRASSSDRNNQQTKLWILTREELNRFVFFIGWPVSCVITCDKFCFSTSSYTVFATV